MHLQNSLGFSDAKVPDCGWRGQGQTSTRAMNGAIGFMVGIRTLNAKP